MNRADYRDHIRWNAPRGEQCGSARLTAEKVRYIRANPFGKTLKALAAELGVHHRTVEKAHYGETWAHVD